MKIIMLTGQPPQARFVKNLNATGTTNTCRKQWNHELTHPTRALDTWTEKSYAQKQKLTPPQPQKENAPKTSLTAAAATLRSLFLFVHEAAKTKNVKNSWTFMCFYDFQWNHFVGLFHPSGEASRRGQDWLKRVPGTSGPKMDPFLKENDSFMYSSDSPSGKRFEGGQRGPPRRGSARGNPRVSGDQVSTKKYRAPFRISDLEKKESIYKKKALQK